MRKEELRLGNYVKTIYDTLGVIKITEIKESVIYSDKTKGVSYGSLLPIQLTEEILLKIEGIEKDKKQPNRYILKDSPYAFEIEDAYWDEPCIDIIGNGVYITCVEFVHELQNTMFSLLKEELTITL